MNDENSRLRKQKNLAARERQIFAGTEILTTIRDWVRFAVSKFRDENLAFGQGTASAFDEAVYLIQSALNLPLDGPETFFDAKLTKNEISKIKKFLSKRILERVPAAYITNEAWLGNYNFFVDERTIVPRSYIAEFLLVPEKLSPWIADFNAISRVCDICTGGASLAILAAGTFPNAKISAADISIPALEVASINVSSYALEEKISLFVSDVFDGIPEKNFEVIISNPPYEPDFIEENLPTEFRKEPQNALFSGADGMDVIRKILRQSANKISKNGILLLEVGALQSELESAFPRIEFNWLETADGTNCVCLIEEKSLKKQFGNAGKSDK